MSIRTSTKQMRDWIDEWIGGSDLDFYSLWVQGIPVDQCYEKLRENNLVRVPLNCWDIIAGLTFIAEEWVDDLLHSER